MNSFFSKPPGVLSKIFLIIFILIIFFVLLWLGLGQKKALLPGGETISAECSPIDTANFGLGTLPDTNRAKNITMLLDSATRDLTLKLHSYQKSPGDIILKDIQELARKRKEYLVETAYRNPNAALFSTLLENDRNIFANITKHCSETETTLEGTLEVLHADLEDGFSDTRYTFSTPEGNTINLHPASNLHVSLESRTRIKVKGIRIDNELIFNGARSLEEGKDFGGGINIISQPGNPPVYGDQKVLVILANFQNTAEPPLTQDSVRATVFGEVNKYYKENSYGNISLSGKVIGWYALPLNQNCNAQATWSAAIRAADREVNYREYSRLIVIAPLGPACGWGGFATTGMTSVYTDEGAISVSISAIRSNFVNLTAIGHELGHNFGNHHAGFYKCDYAAIASSGCTWREYGDIFDIMGSKNTAHYNALHKEYLGWFTPDNILTVSKSGTYTLEPIENADSGLKALKIQRGINDYLFVEYRQPLGYDYNIAPDSNVFSGALLHIKEIGGSPNRSALIDPVPPGDLKNIALLPGFVFRDPGSGATITTTYADPESLRVKVTVVKTNFIPPEVRITYPIYQQTVSGKITISAQVTHTSGIDRVEFYYIKRGEQILFGKDQVFPYEADLDTSELPTGINYILAKAYDSTRNEGISSIIGFLVALNDPEPPQINFISPKDGEITSNPVEFRAEANDNQGIYYVLFKIDTDSSNGYTLTARRHPYKISSILRPGPHTVLAEARDLSGNISRSEKRSFTVSEEFDTDILKKKEVSALRGIVKEQISLPVSSSVASAVVELPYGTVGSSYSITLASPETGKPPFVWSIPYQYGKIPPGLNLTSSGLISGIPTETGLWNFTIKVEDNAGIAITRDIKIEIKTKLAILTASLPQGRVGESYNANLNTEGIDPPFIWSVPSGYGNFPPGLNLNSSGSITGVPTEPGKWGFTARVKDSSDASAARDFVVEIRPYLSYPESISSTESITSSQPTTLTQQPFIPSLPSPAPISYPSITTFTLSSATSGITYRETLIASSGSPPYKWNISSGALPSGLSLDSSSGLISGSPTSNQGGYNYFTVRVEDSKNISWTKSLYMEVKIPPSLTLLSPKGGEKLILGTPYDIRWNAKQVYSGIDIQIKNISTNEIIFEKKGVYNTGSFSWTPLGSTPVSNAKVFISVPDLVLNSESDTAFSIDLPQGALTIRGKFVNYFTKTPLAGVEISGPNSVGQYLALAKTSVNGELTILTPPLDAASNYRSFSYQYSCYGNGSLTLQKNNDGSVFVASSPFNPISYVYQKFPMADTAADLGDIPIWPAVGLEFTSDIPVKAGVEYLGESSSAGFSDYKTSHSFGVNALPLNHETRLKITDNTGTVTYSPYAKFSLEHGCKPATLNFSQSKFIWGPEASILPPLITTTSMPGGSLGTGITYNFTLGVSGGIAPYVWNIASGELPTGLGLDGSTGIISGKPGTSGIFNFTTRVLDSFGKSAEKPLSIGIKAPGVSSLPAPISLEASWFVNYGGNNTLSRSLTLAYASSSVANAASFRMYEKKPDDSIFNFVAEFPGIASATCSSYIASGNWLLSKSSAYVNGTYICGFDGKWNIYEKDLKGNYIGYFPPSQYPVGEYSYYIVAIDSDGNISPQSTTAVERFLDPLTILSPTEAQSPVTGTTTFKWTVASGWPAGVNPYTIYLFDGTTYVWSKGGLGLSGEKAYNGPALDPSKKYTLHIYGKYKAPDKTDYISMDAATATFWIAPPPSPILQIFDSRVYANVIQSVKIFLDNIEKLYAPK